MKVKERLLLLYNACDKKFEEQFEFKIAEASLDKIAAYMYKPTDPSSLAVTRILFGLAMLFDIPDERGGATMDRRWGDPKICHFPLLPCVTALPMPYMAFVYASLWLGALGIMLGYKYRVTSATFAACYWYLFLIEKSYWNNHSYLFGLVGLLLACTDASCYWSLDAYLDPTKRKTSVPYWNYFVLKYQFFILYFMAGLKKGTAEWLSGYSVQNLSEHWVFAPFKLFLTVPQTDYLVVHWFVFAFDLTVAGWMMWSRSRHLAVLFCALFHLMNSRLFRIGMFPWVCLATMPLFYPFDWPKLAIHYVQDKVNTYKEKIRTCIIMYNKKKVLTKNGNGGKSELYVDDEDCNAKFDQTDMDDDVFITEKTAEDLNNLSSKDKKNNKPQDGSSNDATGIVNENVIKYNKSTIYFIIIYMILQAFLPYSHFITKGYNNWTDGLYGYSWDMMVHTWEPHAIIVKVVDHSKKNDFYVDPYLFTPNDRWTRHGDMVYQYAHCIEKKIVDSNNKKKHATNISIHVDVWTSMNGRFVQRMFDPKVDLLKATWSPFQATHYLMPLLDEALHWRQTLHELRDQVASWGELSDVTFFADFPRYDQEKFIPAGMKNITFTVLDGDLAFEPEVTKMFTGQTHKLASGDRVKVASGMFHRVLNVGDSPAFYMYTFYNGSETAWDMEQPKAKLPIGSELVKRFLNMVRFAGIVVSGIVQSLLKLSECH